MLARTRTLQRRILNARSLSAASSPWGNVAMAPADPILGLSLAFQEDEDPRKISVGVGAYRDEAGKPYVLPSVRKAEQLMLEKDMNHEYLGITGDVSFNKLAPEFLFGENSAPLQEGRVAVSQVLSGTGGLRVAFEFIKRFSNSDLPILVPTPTWGNHHAIIRDAGLKETKHRYYDPATNGLDFAGMCEDLHTAPNGSVVLLHACAHNPTGVDPSLEQWKEISSIMKGKEMLPFFDSAYQGFASGDSEQDAAAVRHFVDEGHCVITTQSFSKNFGLYNDRVGALSVVCADEEEKKRVDSQLKLIIRPMYSNPPAAGARIVSLILSDKELAAQWRSECRAMADRIISARAALKSNLESLGSKSDWSHITDQIGMFAFSGLSKEQCARMISEHHIYMTADGRISMAGVTAKNAKYIAESIMEVTGGN